MNLYPSAMGGIQGKGEGRGENRMETAVEGSINEIAGRVARYQAD